MTMSSENWTRLSRGLRSLQFAAFGLSNLNAEDLIALDAAVAKAESSLTTVTEPPEWAVISRQLGLLDPTAKFIALRPEGHHLEIVLGRGLEADGIAGAAEYAKYVADLLASMSKATQSYKLSPEAMNALNEASGAADKLLRTAAELVLPLLRFQGEFRCVILHAVAGASAELAQQWPRRWMVEWRPPIIGVRQCIVSSWLWDTSAGSITRVSGDAMYLRMANVSPESLLRVLRFGQNTGEA